MGRFFSWIEEQGGAKAVARMLDTESPTVNSWLRKKARPRDETKQILVRLGKGAFDLNDIINETKPQRKK